MASSMMGAILFGEKDEMDEDVLEDFRKNGTAHVLAVSGLHIGIIYAVISKLWRWGKRQTVFCRDHDVFLLLCSACIIFTVSDKSGVHDRTASVRDTDKPEIRSVFGSILHCCGHDDEKSHGVFSIRGFRCRSSQC